MTDLNSISLIGRCVRDISNNDFAYTPNGKARLAFSIAVNRSRKQGDQWIDEVSYIDCLVWGAFAETLKQKLHKGMRVAVAGSIRQDRWKDNNGNNRSRVYVVADSIQNLESSVNQNGGNYQNGNNQNNYQNNNVNYNGYQQQPQQQAGGNYQQSVNEDYTGDGFPEDIPF